MPTNMTDGAGYLWDFTTNGSIYNGTSDAFDGGLALSVSDGASTVSFMGTVDSTLEDGGREQVFTGSGTYLGLSLIRKAYVPASGAGFARFTEFFTNTTASTITRTVIIASDLGSDSGTITRATSSGDTTMTTADNWLITDDTPTDNLYDPAVLHYFATASGIRPTMVGNASGVLSYRYDLTLAPGETKGIIHFAAQHQVYADLLAVATLIDGQGAALYTGMTAAEQDQLVNVDRTLETSTTVTALPVGYANLELTGTANINGTGNASDNRIIGNSGNNRLNGLAGNDTLVGLGGNDTMDGGEGIDTATFSEKSAPISVALDGANYVRVYVGGVIEDAVRNIEHITGGSGDDSIAGDGLGNKFYGGNGNDTLRGGGGNDTMNGGNGTDTATYSEVASSLTVDLTRTGSQNTGGGGTDALSLIENLIGSATAANRLTGNDANNSLEGGAANDTIMGGLGNDTVEGSGGNDLIYGEASGSAGSLVRLDSDSFVTSAATVTFDSVGTVNPTYSMAVTGIGTVNVTTGGWFVGQLGGTLPGQPGVTTLVDNTPATSSPLTLDGAADQTHIATDYDSPTSPILSGTPEFNGPISVKFSTPVAGVALTGGYFNAVGSTYIEAYDTNGVVLGRVTNTLIGIEFFGLAMSSGDRKIAGISFYISADEPAGFGIDNLTFGASSEITDFSNTHDWLRGGAGNDTIYGGTGNDFINGGADNNSMIGGTGEDTVTYVSATGGVTVSLATTSAQNTVNAGLDTLIQIENLEGSYHADSLTGNSSANVLKGQTGNDTIDGGAGVDTARYNDKTTGITVTLSGSTLAAVTVGGITEDRIKNIENVEGGSGHDRIVGDGFANQLIGFLGNDTLSGMDGADVLYGSDGNDTLSGGLGNDRLSGDAGTDTLNGGSGLDTLIGGTGNDFFVFDTVPNTTTNFDVVSDFAAGDKFRLENTIYSAFVSLAVGASPAAGAVYSAAGATAAHDADDRLVYNPTTGYLYYDADGAGGAAAIRFAFLSNKPASLAATDFLMI